MDEKKTIQRQKADFDRLESIIGPDLAIYCVCAVYDIPFDPDSDAESWEDYAAKHSKGGFGSGNTNVQSALLSGMAPMERWETIWGEGYSESDYRQLDDLYQTMTAQLDSTGGIDRQQDDTARTCAMMALQRNKLIRSSKKDDIATAKTFDQMIRENLKDSNMRKADILPSAVQRLDGIVDALRKKYGLNMEMTKDDVWDAFHRWCQKKKYPFTMDAAEHMIMLILNLIQKNDDLPELSDKPEGMDFNPFSSEFADEPNDAEMESYQYLGLVRGEFKTPEDD